MKVLIVDDDDDVRTLLSLRLSMLGATPIECRDGMTAVSRYHTDVPDAVLMDIAMPEMDGLETTQRIREMDENACIYILTAYSDDMLRRAASVAGAAGYFLKDSLDPLMNLLGRRADRLRVA